MKRDERLPIDHETRERVRNDLDTSFCVEAGAGTGKTTLLVDRYLSIIRSGRAPSRGRVSTEDCTNGPCCFSWYARTLVLTHL